MAFISRYSTVLLKSVLRLYVIIMCGIYYIIKMESAHNAIKTQNDNKKLIPFYIKK